MNETNEGETIAFGYMVRFELFLKALRDESYARFPVYLSTYLLNGGGFHRVDWVFTLSLPVTHCPAYEAQANIDSVSEGKALL